MSDFVDRNKGRIDKIKECAYSIISTIQEMNNFDGDVDDLDDPFWGEIGSLQGDVDLISEKSEEME